METYAGIVRVSHMGSRKSGDADYHSEREQVQAINGAAEQNGARVVLLPPELGVSGGLPLERRPSLLRAVEGIESGLYAGLIVAYHSRIGRDVEHEEAVWRRVEAAGGRIIMALDGIDASTVDGRMVRRIRSAINTREREAHAASFELRAKEATAGGIWQRRQTPKGYDKDPQTRRLVPNEDADFVRWAFRSRPSGVPVVQIAAKLGMTPKGVRNLLKNPLYLGRLKVRSYVNPSAHPALVTVQEFEAAQATTARPQKSSRHDGPALLAGLVLCAGCGHLMPRGAGKVVHYKCAVHHSGSPCPNPAAITLTKLDAHVEAIAVDKLRTLAVSASASDNSDSLTRALEAAESELEAYLTAISVEDVGPDAFKQGAQTRKAKVEERKEALRAELARRPADLDYATAADIWPQMTARQKNRVLRSLVACVVVERSGGRGVIRPLEERVRVLDVGAKVIRPGRSSGIGMGLHPIDFGALNPEDVLSPVHLAQHR